jgi:drug/metabolite transporter (DMT)-like permease
MTGGTGYALAALACYGLGDFIYKRATAAGVTPHHFLMGQAWCFAPAIVLYGLATGTLVLRTSAIWNGLAGLFMFIGLFHFLRSLASGPVSIAAPIFRLNFVVTSALAILVLGEPLTPAMPVALLLALVATWLLLGGGEGARQAKLDSGWLLAVMIATVSLGAANFFHALGVRHGSTPETALSAQAIVFVTLATIFVRASDGEIAPPRAMWKHAAAAAVVLMGAFLLMLYGLTLGPASVLVPITQMGFVVTAALGIALLGEPVTMRKTVGLVAAVGALAALAFG